MMPADNEELALRMVALQNAQSILHARRRAEEELRQQSEWLRVTLASIGDAVISTDTDGRVNFMNAVAESLTGWTQSEALGHLLPDVFRIFGQGTREPADNPALRALHEGAVVNLADQVVLVARDGTERPIDDSAAPIRSAQSDVMGSVLVFRDISRRQQADQALQRSERDLADFFENANVGLHWVGPDGTILRVNQAELDMLGYAREEYVGHHIADFHVDRAVIDDILERLNRGEKLQGHAARMRCKDGSVRHVLINSSVLFEGDRFVHTRCFTLDVTHHRTGQEALARLAAIVEASDDSIVSKDLDGVIRSWNPGAERMFGFTAGEAVGRFIDLIIPPERRSEEREILARLRAGQRIEHYETVRLAKSGRRLNVSLSISPIKDSSGVIIGATKVARDITERKQAEAEREAILESERAARSEAERANRLKDQFLATLSHELRTPLSAILGWTHILRKSPPTAAAVEEGLGVIDRNARVQSQLVADLLDMSRIISGKMRLDVQRVELPVVIEAALDVVRPAAAAKEVRIQSVLEPIIDPVHGDPARLQQVFWNLLSNAVKFTPRGGRVQLVLRRVNSHVEIIVSDTGEGIATEFLTHVFERFRQGDSTASRAHGGLGLGLSIVKQLVELHGGRVHATSEGRGKGSTFTVELPLAVALGLPDEHTRAHPRAERSSPPASDAAELRGLTVLVVEDEADARDLIRRILEDGGASVLLAACATEALAVLDVSRPDVIVSDLGMPGHDGYWLMRAIRERGVRTPAAALTAFARSEDRTRALRAGYQTHVAKPVEAVELVAAVAALAHARASGAGEVRS